jgi:predicted MFS family arabinose efflux permease
MIDRIPPVVLASVAVFAVMVAALGVTLGIVIVRNRMRIIPERYRRSDYAKAGAAGVLVCAIICLGLGLGLTLFGAIEQRGYGDALTFVSGVVAAITAIVAFSLRKRRRR